MSGSLAKVSHGPAHRAPVRLEKTREVAGTHKATVASLISRGLEKSPQELAPYRTWVGPVGCPGVKGPIPQPVLMSALTLTEDAGGRQA